MKTATTYPPPSVATFDVDRVRADFPILRRRVRGKPLVYLDNAATAQKPNAVLGALRQYYEEDNANVHRGIHFLSETATLAYEGARENVRRFIGAAERSEVVFVRGTTEGINLVADTWGRANISAGDEIIVTIMEHHSNLLPWQRIAAQTGATIKAIPMTDAGDLVLDEFDAMLSDRTRLVAVTHVSNTLGTVNPVAEIIARAHARGAAVLVDGAQAVPHMPVNVRELDCDFYVFSGHKLYGPTGIGVLYGKAEHLAAMPPYQGGGGMVRTVTITEATFLDSPERFEAGTPNIAGAIALSAAIDYLKGIGWDAVVAHEQELMAYATGTLAAIDGLKIFGKPAASIGVISFALDNIHPHDVATIFDSEGIAIRAGHHCTQPLMARLGVAATVRASFALYTSKQEVDRLAAAVPNVIKVLS